MATCRRFSVTCAVVLAAALVIPALTTSAAPPARTPDIIKTTPSAVVSQPLATVAQEFLRKLKEGGEAPAPIQYREVNPKNTELPGRIANAPAPSGQVDTVVQGEFGPLAMPSPTVNIAGLSSNDNSAVLGGRLEPPDTEGDVGPNHYVEWINLLVEVFDKSGNSLAGPFAGNDLWSGFGGTCETSNDGDPIVLYDSMADRWMLSQFTGDNHQCIAVSTSPDPLGTYYLYDFNMGRRVPGLSEVRGLAGRLLLHRQRVQREPRRHHRGRLRPRVDAGRWPRDLHRLPCSRSTIPTTSSTPSCRPTWTGRCCRRRTPPASSPA